MAFACIWDHPLLFRGRFDDAAFAQQAYLEWSEHVKATVPPDRLLMFNVKQGWGPLCQFLGVAEPSQPFPHQNTTRDFEEQIMAAHRAQCAAQVALVAAGAALAAACALAVARWVLVG